MIDTLYLAISNKINDPDDFKRLVFRSESDSEAYIYRPSNNIISVYQNEINREFPFNMLFDKLLDLMGQGFNHIICECYSVNINIDVPLGKNKKLKVTYSKPSAKAEIDNEGHIISLNEINVLLEKVEIINPDGYVKEDMRRKYIQIDNFIKLIQPILDKSSKSKKVCILDCGSGKSYLSFVMNYFLREKIRRNCHFFCIDTNDDLIDKCRRIGKEMGYDNMEFHVSMIKDFVPSEKIDIVCSLHACDTATDEAIAKGIAFNSPFIVVVPCCQHEVLDQLIEHPLKAINRHGALKSKLADLLTDTLRVLILESMGYKVSVTEYVSPLYTPKNILIQAEKIQNRNKMAIDQYFEVKSMFGNISIELERLLGISL